MTKALSLCTCYYEDSDKGRVILVCALKSEAAASTAAASEEGEV